MDGLVDNEIKSNSRERQKFGLGPVSIIDPSRMINELRLRKSDAEIRLMRHSAKIAAQAHKAMAHTKPGIGEWQLEGIIEGLFKYYQNPHGTAYPCIGSGENATILHYTVNDDTCDDGEVILIDAGCEYNGYASDITGGHGRLGGKFSDAQAEIYQIVLDAQLAAIDECRVGNSYDAPHKGTQSSSRRS